MMRCVFLFLFCVSGCAISIDGDFDEIEFSPDNTTFGVVQQYHTAANGSVTPLGENDWEAELFFSSAETQSVHEDWRFLKQNDRLDLKKSMASGDTLWIKNIRVSAIQAGKKLNSEDGHFQLLLVQNPPVDESRPLGDWIVAELTFSEIVLETDGYIKGDLQLIRKKRDRQPKDTAIGTVNITYKIPLVGERVAKSNLSFVAPVLTCAAQSGQMAAECAFDN